MKLTNDARKFIYHCLLMDDTNPFGWSDADLVRYWTIDCNEEIPQEWIENSGE
jgi:hypothetical protein